MAFQNSGLIINMTGIPNQFQVPLKQGLGSLLKIGQGNLIILSVAM
jgi:hypothetical protein